MRLMHNFYNKSLLSSFQMRIMDYVRVIYFIRQLIAKNCLLSAAQ